MKRALSLCMMLVLAVGLMTTGAATRAETRGGFTPHNLPERDPILVPTMEFEVNDGPKSMAANKYAVIIGISDYYGTSSDLRYCDDDAYDVRTALINEFGFPSSNIKMLIDSQATYANILAAVNWLVQSAGPNDYVAFWYSGHGSYGTGNPDGDNEATDECIIPWELSRLWDGTLAQAFSGLNCAKAWISFDSCYSGGMNDPGISGTKRTVTMACKETQLSGESSSIRNGFFTYLMVERGITQRRADSDGNGLVSIDEAWTYAYNNIRSYTSSQTPTVTDGYTGQMFLYY